MDDLIQRQAVLEMAYDLSEIDGEHFTEPCMVVDVEDIQKLQPVNLQEPKTGHWIKSRDCYGNHHFTCSECGNDIATQYADNWNDKHCSECGAKMVEPQESEDKG